MSVRTFYSANWVVGGNGPWQNPVLLDLLGDPGAQPGGSPDNKSRSVSLKGCGPASQVGHIDAFSVITGRVSQWVFGKIYDKGFRPASLFFSRFGVSGAAGD